MSEGDIVGKAIDDWFNDPENRRKIEELDRLMQAINPSARCLLCSKSCGPGHVICFGCYFREKARDALEARRK